MDTLTLSLFILSFIFLSMLGFTAVVTTMACVHIFVILFKISHPARVVFLRGYLAYRRYLRFNATQRSLLALFSHTMRWFVLPFTLIASAFFVYKARQQKLS